MADELFRDHRNGVVQLVRGADDFPRHRRRMRGDAAINLAVEIFDDLGAALVPPILGRRHLRPIGHQQRVGQLERRHFRFVVVCRVGRLAIVPIGSWAQRRDVELIHHPPVVLLGGHFHGWRIVGPREAGAQQKQGESEPHQRPPR